MTSFGAGIESHKFEHLKQMLQTWAEPAPDRPLLQNNEALAQLRQELDTLEPWEEAVKGALAEGENNLSHGLTLVTQKMLSKHMRKIEQLCGNTAQLLESFRRREVIVTPRVPVPGHGTLDFFIRFPQPPNKVNFAVAFRSQRGATITYNEEKESLYIRHRTGGLNQWKPDHIFKLAQQESWIRMNRPELLGDSSRDKRRSIIKLLILGRETKLGHHQERLYVQHGHLRVLLLRKHVSLYVLEEFQFIPFIDNWLTLKKDNS